MSMNESRPHDDDSTDTEPAAYTVHHIPESAAERAEEMAERLLANPTIHDYEVEIAERERA